ncbi:DUF4198 domain-containing protein [Flavobacterium subsaxonicum]|uniref:Ferredoxin n=1 Tax=Flavobacterium subsaxonicum WB 4.1-42 = DSM 21790 TaxID=1121898 RepID=A0A0A2MHY0_9FLAO|nr:DUF4198 domain-containing protein [Flavobacterium subsaxonicum]KGO92242.1 ferredoxin [Flavobacterium subsaxonicum WB 4.1-42 = DSM 21790]
MKKCLLLLLALVASGNAFAHFMWVETSATGKVNQKQEVKVFFGEYTYGLQEKVGGEAFEKMKNFEVWAVAPNGEKTLLELKPGELFYSGYFTPKTNGTYTIVLNNNKIDVIDYTQYDFGIFKTHYHAITKTQIGGTPAPTAAINADGLTVVDTSVKEAKEKGETTLKVLYKGEPAKETEVTVFINDQWSKKLYTDANGLVKFTLPWNTKYVIEVTKKEEVPGKYNGKDYQFVWHCATYTIPLAKN